MEFSVGIISGTVLFQATQYEWLFYNEIKIKSNVKEYLLSCKSY